MNSQKYEYSLYLNGRIVFQTIIVNINKESMNRFINFCSNTSIPSWLSYEQYKLVAKSIDLLANKVFDSCLIPLKDNVVFNLKYLEAE